MKIYSPKSLIKGYKLGLKNGFAQSTLYAVPTHNLPCIVKVENKHYELGLDTFYVMEKEFDDKFKEGAKYYLRYYDWQSTLGREPMEVLTNEEMLKRIMEVNVIKENIRKENNNE